MRSLKFTPHSWLDVGSWNEGLDERHQKRADLRKEPIEEEEETPPLPEQVVLQQVSFLRGQSLQHAVSEGLDERHQKRADLRKEPIEEEEESPPLPKQVVLQQVSPCRGLSLQQAVSEGLDERHKKRADLRKEPTEGEEEAPPLPEQVVLQQVCLCVCAQACVMQHHASAQGRGPGAGECTQQYSEVICPAHICRLVRPKRSLCCSCSHAPVFFAGAGHARCGAAGVGRGLQLPPGDELRERQGVGQHRAAAAGEVRQAAGAGAPLLLCIWSRAGLESLLA